MPAHFPEVGLKPGGFLEDHDQLCLAGRCDVEIGETLQMRPRFRRDLLVCAPAYSAIQTRYGFVAACASGREASRVAISA